MNDEMLARILTIGLVSLILFFVIFSRNRTEARPDRWDRDRQKYLPYINGGLLPLYILIRTALTLLFDGASQAAGALASLCFEFSLQISIYFLLLIPAISFFRRHISARTCSVLWLIPGFLHFVNSSSLGLSRPLAVISVPGILAEVLFFIWLAGFLGVLLWKTAEHFSFRRRILSRAVPVTDPQILSLWQKALTDVRMNYTQFFLGISPDVKVPLSVGLFDSSTCVLLPKKDYAPADLELIFRHEVIHIARDDSWSKFFLTFCTAICWFHPLMWTAMRKSAEDMELSCDETVLLNAGENTRKRYALLLLDTAGDGRGFTTCLSASANTLRYRLKNIMHPAKKRSGAIAAALLCLVLMASSGHVTLAYGRKTGRELLYGGASPSSFSVSDISITEGDRQTYYEPADEAAFHEYLSRLTFSELTGNYSFASSDRSLRCTIISPERRVYIDIFDQWARVTVKNSGTSCYRIVNGLNRDDLDRLLSEESL